MVLEGSPIHDIINSKTGANLSLYIACETHWPKFWEGLLLFQMSFHIARLL